MVKRELAEISKIIRDFDDNNSEDGKPVFTKTIGFYLDELKFDSGKVLGWFEDEIKAVKSEKNQIY